MDKYMREFYENVKHKFKYGAHNLYELTSVDMDGNVVDRKFGINVLTNHGFSRYYMINTTHDYYDIRLGDGSGVPSVTDTDFFHQTLTAGGIRTGNSGENRPKSGTTGPKEILYDSSTGIISGVYCFDSWYWEYNYSGINNPVPVTEIGIFLASAMAVHSLVYDKYGNLGSITKNPNQRLFLKVYYIDNIDETLIQNAYSNGIYFMINPSVMIPTDTYSSIEYSLDWLHSNNPDGTYWEYSTSDYWGTVKNHDLAPGSTEDRRVTWNEGARVIDGKRQYFDIITFTTDAGIHKPGTRYYSEEMVTFTLDRLPQPETLESETFFTNSVSSVYFTNSFGKSYNSNSHAGEFPVVDFDMTSLKMYNQLTDDWDIDESYINAPYTDYTNPFIFSCHIRVRINGSLQNMYVYCNPFAAQYHLLGVSNTGIVLYATDKYWDVSTYEIIPNLAAIPAELQQKRYYVSFSETMLSPSWDYAKHKLDNSTQQLDTIIDLYDTYTYMRGDENYDPKVHDPSGAVLIGVTMFFPNETGCPSYRLPYLPAEGLYYQQLWLSQENAFFTNGGNTMIWRRQCNYNNHSNVTSKTFRVFDMTTCTSSSAPTYYDFDLNVSWTDNYRRCWTSVNDRGIMVVSEREITNDYTAHIVDINHLDGNNMPTQHTITYARWCQPVECTTNYIYYDPRDNYFRIKSVIDDTLVSEFQLPQDQGISIYGMHAWKNKVMISGNQSSVYCLYVYDISTGSLKTYTNRMIRGLFMEFDRQWYKHIYSCDDFIIIGGGSDNVANNTYWDTIMMDTGRYADDPFFFENYYCMYHLQVKSVNNGKQTLAIMYFHDYNNYTSHWVTYVVDIGYLRNRGVNELTRYGVNRLESYRSERSNVVMTQDKVLLIPSSTGKCTLAPYETLLPHKTTGTTTTIQAYNNPKRVSGKQFKLTLTNNPSKYSPT